MKKELTREQDYMAERCTPFYGEEEELSDEEIEERVARFDEEHPEGLPFE